MSWVIYDFSHMFICLLWFCHRLLKDEIVKTCMIHLLGTYVTILCNWLIFWQNALYLCLGRFRMCLILQETLFQVQVWKPCKSPRHLIDSCICQSLKLDTCYLLRFKKDTEILVCFLGIRECVFGTSFLLILDIYKAYFRGRYIREYKGEYMKKVIDGLFSVKEATASLCLRVL